MTILDYKAAGVDIEAGNEAVRRIKKAVEETFSTAVLTPLGSFGALYDLKTLIQDYQHPVLVQSIDGVGTKTIIAGMMKKYDTLGIDLVSATTNDIVVLGAKPLTLLDYIANDRLRPEVIEQLVLGMSQACKENQISLVGGETAEMPGTYLPGEIDLAGIITGVVDREKVILGKNIVPGDLVFGFASSGLHTNGYSLARKLFFERGQYTVESLLPELQGTLGEVLLEPHLNYNRPVHAILDAGLEIKGMAHITGGGLLENVPRILPSHCSVEILKGSFPQQAIFSLLQALGQLDETELYRTFNMGIGLILIIAPEMADHIHLALRKLPQFKLYELGQVVPGEKRVTLCA